MSRQNELSEQEQRLLEKVEQILANSEDEQETSLYRFCAHLASTVPQANDAFRQRLEAHLLTTMQQRKSHAIQVTDNVAQYKRQPVFQRHWSRVSRGALIGLTLLLLSGIVLAIPQTRAVLAAWFGFSFERRERLQPLVVEVLNHDWQSPLVEAGGASFEVYSVEFPSKRWAMIEKANFATPKPGSRVLLPNEDTFPVPAYLPEGYRWQDVTVMHGDLMGLGFPSLASQSWAGGGLPVPPYDLQVNYLIGGDASDRFLILAQFQGEGEQGLLFQVFHAAETEVGLVIQPTEQQAGLVFLVGPGELHEATVNETPAWWYQGAWNAAGEWVEDATWINLVWKSEDTPYQLAGQNLPVEELIRIAESLP